MIRKTLIAGLLLLLLSASAWATTCVADVPACIWIGTSACVQVCPRTTYTIELRGNVEGTGAAPVLTFIPGCPTCGNANCTPITPPTSLVLGGDPYEPESYYGASSCIVMHLDYGHVGGFWYLTVHSNTSASCHGCFCITFDHQLAVEISRGLSAVAVDNQINLAWATASESSNNHFEVMRDGQLATSIPGLGTSATGKNYSWSDHQVQNGAHYTYELIAVDMSGNRRSVGTASATAMNAQAGIVSEYALYQNYPNPFNPTTCIRFDVVDAGLVTLKVFNPMGGEVATLVNGELPSGAHTVNFDASRLPSGIYFYSLVAGEKFSATRKMLLVK